MHSDKTCHICKDYLGPTIKENGEIDQGCQCAAKVAAFPDMLAALKMAEIDIGDDCPDGNLAPVVAAAIAKAEEAEGK